MQKKIEEKNLTSVSFAFTHAYTAVKTNSFRFFPQAYMENFEKCAKTGDMGTLGGGSQCLNRGTISIVPEMIFFTCFQYLGVK